MNMKECYEQFGGDYKGVFDRLGKEERIIKYTRMFAGGNDYALIEDSLAAGNKEEAFRNVHNLKGVALNLGLTPLHMAADVLCEALRPGKPPVSDEELEKMRITVKEVYDNIVTLVSNVE